MDGDELTIEVQLLQTEVNWTACTVSSNLLQEHDVPLVRHQQCAIHSVWNMLHTELLVPSCQDHRACVKVFERLLQKANAPRINWQTTTVGALVHRVPLFRHIFAPWHGPSFGNRRSPTRQSLMSRNHASTCMQGRFVCERGRSYHDFPLVCIHRALFNVIVEV